MEDEWRKGHLVGRGRTEIMRNGGSAIVHNARNGRDDGRSGGNELVGF